MLLLKGIAGKAYIVGMLAKENGVKVVSYKEELNTVPDAVIYDADISHKAPCLTIVNGAISEINVKDGKAKVLFKYE